MYRGSSRPSWVSVVLWLLLHSLPDLSESSSSPLLISCHVGHETKLPCNWTSLMQAAQQPDLSPYLQWRTPKESVFEMREEERYEGVHFRGRVGVEVQLFKNGDCSLLMKQVQFSDAGQYESFVTVGSRRRRSFINSMQLIVRDHKYKEVLKEGQNLELKLHTHLASTVIFQKAGAPESQMIWERDSGAWGSRDWGGRLTQGDEKRERLILSGVKMEDAGTYKVLDPQGLAVSTVHLTVEDVIPTKTTLSDAEAQREHYDSDKEVSSPACRVGFSFWVIMGSLLFFKAYAAF